MTDGRGSGDGSRAYFPAAPDEPVGEEPATDTLGGIRADAIDEFVNHLRHVRMLAGSPSLRDVAKSIKRTSPGEAGASTSTLCRIFNGQQLPRWEVLCAILAALSIPPKPINTTWRQRWMRARMRWNDPNRDAVTDEELPPPAEQNSPAPLGEECDECGAWITSTERHHAWHWRIERRPPARPIPPTIGDTPRQTSAAGDPSTRPVPVRPARNAA